MGRRKEVVKEVYVDSIEEEKGTKNQPVIQEQEEIKESFEESCRKAAEKYIDNCKKFEIKVDANVVISLTTG